jgi:hypothetical protein
MATTNTTTAAASAASLLSFEDQARADGYLDEHGYFTAPHGYDPQDSFTATEVFTDDVAVTELE